MSRTSRFFRLVSVICCILIVSTGVMADGFYAAGSAVYGAGTKGFRAMVLRLQGRPGWYSENPGQVFKGEHPGKDADLRGGLWTREQLDEYSGYLTTEEAEGDMNFWQAALAPAIGKYLIVAASRAGSPTLWEGEAGGVNTATGNKETEEPIVTWPAKGDVDIDLTLYHNSQATFSTYFGQSWSNSYDIRITALTTSAVIRWGDGTSIPYTKSGSNYLTPAGIHDKLVKNGNGTWTITTHEGIKYNCNTSGYLTSIVDRSGNTTTIGRDAQNKITTITDPSSRQIAFTYTGTKCTSITDPLSRTWSFAYDGSGNLTTITYPVLNGVNYTHGFTYNTSHSILTLTDKRGKVWVFTYGTSQELLTAKTPLNHTTSYSYTSTDTTITLPGSQTWVDNYSSGKLASRVDGGGFSESYVYDSDGNKTSVTDKRGKTWAFTFDTEGNVLTKTNPLSKTWSYSYNASNDLLTETDPLSHVTTMTYNTGGKVLTVVDPISRTVQTNTYNTDGSLATTKNALNETYTMGYNANGDLTSVTDPLTHAVSFGYDTLGRQTSVTDGASNTTSTSYDNWERPEVVTYPGSVTKTTSYNAEDEVTSVTNERSKVTSFVYDDSGRMTSTTNANAETESYGYNSNGWRTSVTNGRGKTRNYTFNSRGQVYTLTLPDSSVETWTYNANGDLASYTNPLSETIDYVYDDAARQTTIDYPTGTDTVFTYDDADRRTDMADSTGTTTWTYNNASEVTQLATPQGTINYTYYSSGRRNTMQEVGVGTTTYSYDSAGRLTSLVNPFSETTSWTYDAANRVTRETKDPGTYTDYGYDSRSRVTSIDHKQSGGTAISSESYVYDNTNNLTSKTVNSVTTSYTYDDIDQLLSESRTGYSASYTFDANGNRLTKTLNGTTENYSYDDADKMLTAGAKSYGYDACGRTTSVTVGGNTTTLAYDYEDRLTQITYPSTATNTFSYNGLDTRVGKVDSAGTATYLRDGVGVTAPVINDGTANYTPGVSERRSGSTSFVNADRLGSTTHLTDATEATTGTREYDAYGMTVSSTGSTATPFGFVGKAGYHQDADSGLMLLGHRYYDASTGRFVTRDPAKDGRNWYSYGRENPARYFDHDGRFWVLVLLLVLVVAGGCANSDNTEPLDVQQKLPPGKIIHAPLKRGQPPIGDDGYPVELHHRNQDPLGPVDEMTQTDHRLGPNFVNNHPKLGQPSEIDRPTFRKQSYKYWAGEWDSGRFERLPGGSEAGGSIQLWHEPGLTDPARGPDSNGDGDPD